MRLNTKIVLVTLIISIVAALPAKSQDSDHDDYDSLLNYYLASDSILLDQLELELAADSMDILDLIDSLIYGDFRYSQLSMRLGYTSDITYAGRNFGIEQHGFAAGISYYNKTGLFADVSGFWNSHLVPAYNPTVLTAGYLGRLSRKLSYTVSYDHFFYNQTDDELSYYPITNSANASAFLELGKITLAGEYSFLFGEESAHRFRANLMYTFSKSKLGFIDRFVFMPTASTLLGSSYIYQINPVYPTISRETRFQIRQILFRRYGEEAIKYLWRNRRDQYLDLEREVFNLIRDDAINYELTSSNVFGIMNYSFSVPFYFYINNFTFALSYHYNIPVALPGEELNLEPNSYAGATLIYNIPFKKKNKK